MSNSTIRIPQARCLQALSRAKTKKQVLSRSKLAVAAGFSETSGTINRVLHGIPKGSSSGDPHKGIIDLGLVKPLTLDIDGHKETNYQITGAGKKALAAFLKSRKLPELRKS